MHYELGLLKIKACWKLMLK